MDIRRLRESRFRKDSLTKGDIRYSLQKSQICSERSELSTGKTLWEKHKPLASVPESAREQKMEKEGGAVCAWGMASSAEWQCEDE